MNNRINFDDDSDLDEIPIPIGEPVELTMCFARLDGHGRPIFLKDIPDDGRQFPGITTDWRQAKQFHHQANAMRWFDSLGAHVRWTMFLAPWKFVTVDVRAITDYQDPTSEQEDAWKIS